MAIRTGRFTITLPSRPVVQGFAAVAGKKEGEGPLAAEFDHIFDDTTSVSYTHLTLPTTSRV